MPIFRNSDYNPDWAVVREEPEGRFIYLVRETKGHADIEKLRFESGLAIVELTHAV